MWTLKWTGLSPEESFWFTWQEVFGSNISCDTDCPEWRCMWFFSVLEANYAITGAFHIPFNELFSPSQLLDTALSATDISE